MIAAGVLCATAGTPVAYFLGFQPEMNAYLYLAILAMLLGVMVISITIPGRKFRMLNSSTRRYIVS